jgi:uncharacterized protein (DUF4415 family)
MRQAFIVGSIHPHHRLALESRFVLRVANHVEVPAMLGIIALEYICLYTSLLCAGVEGERPLKGGNMRKVQAEPYRDIDFSKGKRGPVIAPNPGKTKISIRLDNTVLDHFRAMVEAAGGGNYQSLINDALVAHIQRKSVLIAMRKVVREELAHAAAARETS